MRRFPRSLVLALGLGLAVWGCKRDDPPADAEQPLAFDPDAKAIIEHIEHSPVIELVEPGAEPRERLRYASQAPSRTVRLAMTTEFTGDQPMVDLTIAWTGLEPDGETRRYLYDVVETTAMVKDDMDELEAAVTRKIARAFEAVAGQATGGPAGLERIIQTRGIPTRPQPGYLIESIALPLPEQAIGVGAVWTATAAYEQPVGGLRERPSKPEVAGPKLPRPVPERQYDPIVETHAYTDTTRYTLIERSEDILTVAYEASHMPADPTRAPSSTASGRFVVTLSDPLPRSGTLDIEENVVMPGFEELDDQARAIRSGLIVETRE